MQVCRVSQPPNLTSSPRDPVTASRGLGGGSVLPHRVPGPLDSPDWTGFPPWRVQVGRLRCPGFSCRRTGWVASCPRREDSFSEDHDFSPGIVFFGKHGGYVERGCSPRVSRMLSGISVERRGAQSISYETLDGPGGSSAQPEPPRERAVVRLDHKAVFWRC